MSDQSTPNQVSAADQASGVLVKLLVFTIMLGVIPIGSYFGTLDRVWNGNTTMAAITAVVSANCILLAYILFSIFEDTKTHTPTKGALNVTPEEDRKESEIISHCYRLLSGFDARYP